MLASTTSLLARTMVQGGAAASPVAAASLLLGPVRHYHEKVVEHYEKPRNVGSFNKSDPDVGTGLVGAPACGDVMKLQIKVRLGHDLPQPLLHLPHDPYM